MRCRRWEDHVWVRVIRNLFRCANCREAGYGITP